MQMIENTSKSGRKEEERASVGGNEAVAMRRPKMKRPHSFEPPGGPSLQRQSTCTSEDGRGGPPTGPAEEPPGAFGGIKVIGSCGPSLEESNRRRLGGPLWTSSLSTLDKSKRSLTTTSNSASAWSIQVWKESWGINLNNNNNNNEIITGGHHHTSTIINESKAWNQQAQVIKNFFGSTFSYENLRNLADPGRESALNNVVGQIKSKNRIMDSYHKVKTALREMQDQYVASKDQKNVIVRYQMMKKMVTIYERQYWILIDVPKQELSESPESYCNRVRNTLEDRIAAAPPAQTVPKHGGLKDLLGTSAALANKAREARMLESLKNKSGSELQKESVQLQGEMLKLIKKYQGVRALVTQLHNEFESSKHYPIIPRYKLLKDMIKDVLRAPAFAEICHEIDEI